MSTSVTDIPPQFRDLADLPLWAILLAQHGTSPESGVQLLERLVQHRLVRAFPGDPLRQEKVESLLGFVAWELRPRLSVRIPDALSLIESWIGNDEIAQRFEAETAEELLRAAGITGLIYREEDQLRYGHVLLATKLACGWLLARPRLPELPSDDRDLRALIAASLDEARSDEALDLLAASDVYTIAIAARLSPRTARMPRDDDIQTYTAALERLGAAVADAAQPIAVRGGSWFAIADEGSPNMTSVTDEQFWDWARPDDATTRTYTLWSRSPFETGPPLSLAADQAVRHFKERVRNAAPPGDRFARLPPKGVQALLGRPAKFKDALLVAARRWAAIRNDLLRQLDLEAVGYPPPWSGEPLLVARRGSNETRVEIRWANASPDVYVRDEEPDYVGVNLDAFLAPSPSARIYHDLVDEIEQLLGGSSIESEALSNPASLPAITWR